MTRREALELLGARESRKIGNNTYLQRRDDGALAVMFHATDIVTFRARHVELDSGGWHTVTTAARMSEFSPVRVGADRGGWAVWLRKSEPCHACHGAGKVTADMIASAVKYGPEDGPRAVKTWHYRTREHVLSFEGDTCPQCHGSGASLFHDWEKAHPFYDGIRVSPDGLRLLRTQPARPASFEPVKTYSGWTGSRGRSFGRRSNDDRVTTLPDGSTPAPTSQDRIDAFDALYSRPQVTILQGSDIAACPFSIFVPEHYRADGSCRCDDPVHREKMIREWEYTAESFAAIPTAAQRELAGYWHGGQSSGLYALSSSGTVTPEALSEVRSIIAGIDDTASGNEARRELEPFASWIESALTSEEVDNDED